jgi:hypothetical protein
MEVSGQLQAPATLPPRKEPPLLGGPQSQSKHNGGEETILYILGTHTHLYPESRR